MTSPRRYVEPFVGGGAVLTGLLNSGKPAPFLRWAGGKRKLYDEIVKHFHRRGCSAQGISSMLGACGCDQEWTSYLVADVNADLVAAYQAVRDDVDAVVAMLKYWPRRNKEDYYRIRDIYTPIWRDERERRILVGARLIWLNLFSFNGLWRTNSDGKFNVPCDAKRLEQVSMSVVESSLCLASRLLKGVEIIESDFAATLWRCGEGDVVYCDPPYAGTFVAYASGGFDEAAQLRLAKTAKQAVLRGARVVISNSAVAKTIYDDTLSSLPGYRVETVKARRSVSAKGSSRGVVDEILVSVGE